MIFKGTSDSVLSICLPITLEEDKGDKFLSFKFGGQLKSHHRIRYKLWKDANCLCTFWTIIIVCFRERRMHCYTKNNLIIIRGFTFTPVKQSVSRKYII